MSVTEHPGGEHPPMPGADEDAILRFFRALVDPLKTGPCNGGSGSCTGQRVIQKSTLQPFLPVVRTICDECGRSRYRDADEFLRLARSKLSEYHTDQRRRRAAP